MTVVASPLSGGTHRIPDSCVPGRGITLHEELQEGDVTDDESATMREGSVS